MRARVTALAVNKRIEVQRPADANPKIMVARSAAARAQRKLYAAPTAAVPAAAAKCTALRLKRKHDLITPNL